MRRLAVLLLLVAAPAAAQTIAEEARALVAAKRAAAVAERRSEALDRAADRATDAAAKARAQAAAVAARVQSAEADIAAAQARVRIVETTRSQQRARLAAQQAPITRIAAALQTMARRPAGFAIVQPGSLADLIHVRALLAAGLPAVATRTAALRVELAEAERLARQAAAAAATLRTGQARLETQRMALAKLEAAHRARSLQLADSAMFESDRATALGEQARDIVDLMEELGEQAEVRARLEDLPGPLPRPALPGEAAPIVAPAASASRARLPAYRLPVIGRVVTGLGEVAASGIRARGLTLAVAPGAQVVAPTSGRIAFAGPFRSYGRIVIVDHGSGWTTLIAGLATTAARVGEEVDRGAPLGRAGIGQPRITVELRRNNRPVDIARLAASGA